MPQSVNKALSEYLLTIEKYFPLAPIPIDSSMSHQEFLSLFPAELKRAWKEAKAAAHNWTKFAEHIKGKSWVQYTRNHELLIVPHAYHITVGIQQENLTSSGSIVVLLSFIDKKIGLVYVDLDAKLSNQRPVYNYAANPIFHYPILCASYFPLTKSHEIYSREILTEISSFFPDFTLFDNQFADYKIKAIQTEENFYSNIDLFMVFFERGVPVGIPA